MSVDSVPHYRSSIAIRHLGIGLFTVYRIDGITVAVYGCRHRTVGVLSRFGPYTATAQLTPYFTVFHSRIRP